MAEELAPRIADELLDAKSDRPETHDPLGTPELDLT
jgi:hypothetical protein